MDSVDLSSLPDLTMVKIMKRLFNNEFMSDVQFEVEGQVIFAHSWELIKRSVVFREQFKGNLSDNKPIKIEDVAYDLFYQFVRFIYTDECTVEENTICEILDLARKYKVVKLENKLLNLKIKNYDTILKLFEYGSTNQYELIYNNTFDRIISELDCLLIDKDTFVKMNSNILEAILKSNQIPSKITEVELFDALVCWIDRSCEINRIPISEQRSHFQKLLRLIRFPTMTNKEFYLCVKNHSHLFTNDDISTICQQIVLEEQCKIIKWSTEPRLKYCFPDEMLSSSASSKWVTKFTVLDNLILHGLRFGSGFSDFQIEIIGMFGKSNNLNMFQFKFVESETMYNTVSLGELVKLKPNVDYEIEIKYRKDEGGVCGRKSNVNVIITGPSDLVKITEASRALFEIFFKLQTN